MNLLIYLGLLLHNSIAVAFKVRDIGVQENPFVKTALLGCTIRIIQSSNQQRSLWYSSNGQKLSQSFIVDSYNYTNTLKRSHGMLGPVYHYENYAKPQWIFKTHLGCVAHLYFIENEQDIDAAVGYHFVDYDIRHENPAFIVFWDNSEKNLPWRRHFAMHHFPNTFMDTRIYIENRIKTDLNRIGIICIFCNYAALEKPHIKFIIFPSINPSLLTKLWANWHKNHHRANGILSDFYNKQDFRSETSLTRLLSETYNITTQRFSKMSDSSGIPYWVHRGFHLGATSLASSLTGPDSPRLYWLSHGAKAVEFQFLTVIHRNFLRGHGWSSLLLPFKSNVWWTLVLVCLAVLVVIIHSSNKTTSMHSSYLLTLGAPLTDQFHAGNYTLAIRILLLFWSYFCYSLTVLYGGEMAAQLAVQEPSDFPKHLPDLGMERSTIISLVDFEHPERLPGRRLSNFAEFLMDYRDKYKCHSTTPTHCKFRYELFTRIYDSIYRSFCGLSKANFTTGNPDQPYRCSVHNDTAYDSNILTFFDLSYILPTVKVTYAKYPTFWISPIFSTSISAVFVPWMTRKNYFGRLIKPVVSSWGESGMGAHFDKEAELASALQYFGPGARALYDATKHKAMDFEPMKVIWLRNTEMIFIILLGICLSVFACECAPRLRHFQLFKKTEVVYDLQKPCQRHKISAWKRYLSNIKLFLQSTFANISKKTRIKFE